MTLGEEILRDRVAQVSDPVEWLIGEVLIARARMRHLEDVAHRETERANNMEARYRQAIGNLTGPLPLFEDEEAA